MEAANNQFTAQNRQNAASAALTHTANQPMSRTTMGMLCFLASEAVFFLLLILSYVYFRARGINGPTAKEVLDVPRTAIFTVCLLSSSGTIVLAERALHRARHGAFTLWMIVTVLLGAAFIVGQGIEYYELISDNVTVNRNLFGTTFFTLTGFHGLHVTAGLIGLAIITGMAIFGKYRGPKGPAIEALSWYWHFVDIVWVIIFSLVYLFA